MTAASELEAVPTTLFVFPFTTAATDEDAVCTSDNVASDPALKPAPVRVRVPAAQMSAAILVPDVSVRVAAAHTATGMLKICDESDVDALFTNEPIEVEAEVTVPERGAT
jgi:hypothetical protein